MTRANPLELANSNGRSAVWLSPLSLYLYDEALRKKVNEAFYVVSGDREGNSKGITFEYSDGDVAVTKNSVLVIVYEVRIETSVNPARWGCHRVSRRGLPVSAIRPLLRPMLRPR